MQFWLAVFSVSDWLISEQKQTGSRKQWFATTVNASNDETVCLFWIHYSVTVSFNNYFLPLLQTTSTFPSFLFFNFLHTHIAAISLVHPSKSVPIIKFITLHFFFSFAIYLLRPCIAAIFFIDFCFYFIVFFCHKWLKCLCVPTTMLLVTVTLHTHTPLHTHTHTPYQCCCCLLFATFFIHIFISLSSKSQKNSHYRFFCFCDIHCFLISHLLIFYF